MGGFRREVRLVFIFRACVSRSIGGLWRVVTGSCAPWAGSARDMIATRAVEILLDD